MLWLDGDGTLTDPSFPKKVWYEEVPRRVSRRLGISFEHALKICMNWYKLVDDMLAWYDPDFWASLFGVEIGDLYKPLDLLPDARKFLEEYDGVVYLVTGVPMKYARIQFKKVMPYVDGVVTPDIIERHKADPAFYSRACEYLGCNLQDVLFVDDTPSFVEAARNAGIKSLLIDREGKYDGFKGKITSIMDLLKGD